MSRAYLRNFYRIEDSRGYGFYASGRVSESTLSKLRDKTRHPLPYEDSALEDRLNGGFESGLHYFAFCSKAQLKYWLYRKEWRMTLHDLDFEVKKIRAKGWAGDTQGIFIKETRVDLDTFSLRTF